MQPSNLAVLTQSHKAVAAKKRAKKDQIKEILFDDVARSEFLTGFHKRNVAKRELAKKKAIEREKQQRLEVRRESRRLLAERAAQNAAEVEKAYGAIIEGSQSDEEWTGIPQPEDEQEEEYENEEQLATVTVVEDFDPDTLIYGPSKTTEPAHSSRVARPADNTSNGKSKERDDSQGGTRKKSKANQKKFQYQTKSARNADKAKQRARRTEKAERAGGKASRKARKGRQR